MVGDVFLFVMQFSFSFRNLHFWLFGFPPKDVNLLVVTGDCNGGGGVSKLHSLKLTAKAS